jgi:hypothetical protein
MLDNRKTGAGKEIRVFSFDTLTRISQLAFLEAPLILVHV